MYNINQKFRIIICKHFDNIYFRINLCNLMTSCMKFISLELQQSETVLSHDLHPISGFKENLELMDKG